MHFVNAHRFLEIVMPPLIWAITAEAISRCSQLITMILSKRLVKIEMEAFGECTLHQRIVIPSSVTAINDKEFNGCTNLMNAVFCDEIEEFVSAEPIRGWWIQGVH